MNRHASFRAAQRNISVSEMLPSRRRFEYGLIAALKSCQRRSMNVRTFLVFLASSWLLAACATKGGNATTSGKKVPLQPETPGSAPALCSIRLGTGRAYYPDQLRRPGIQGRVLLEFGLSDRGVPQHVEVVASEPGTLFVPAAETLLGDTYVNCQVTEKGDRYRASFAFDLMNCPRSGPTCSPAQGKPEPYWSPNPPMTITGTHMTP